MSKYSLNIAHQYGEKLESFNSLDEAKQYFLSYKDSLLKRLEDLCKDNSFFSPDYTIDSLKQLEKWYFGLFENNLFDTIGLDREEFENLMSIYFGAVVVRNNDSAKWVHIFIICVNINLMKKSLGNILLQVLAKNSYCVNTKKLQKAS